MLFITAHFVDNFFQNRFAITGNVGAASEAPDDGADTEPATDNEDDYIPAGSLKRKPQGSAGTGIKYVNSLSKGLFI